jgi:Zn-dependent peptidase ImmA (M78 family)
MGVTSAADMNLQEREYVRGRSQLAPFDPKKRATGHRLSGFEAREAYGDDVLNEAIEFGSAVLSVTSGAAAGALRSRREELGLAREEVEQILRVPVADLEADSAAVPFQVFERYALKLGLDERLLSFNRDAGGDRELGVRLKTLYSERAAELTAPTVLYFAEAAAIVRIQNRLADWLQLPIRLNEFQKSHDYAEPAFRPGYNLATVARRMLGLGSRPIPSMRELAETSLGVPVIQRPLHSHIAGATISNGTDRGILLNTVGANSNVWVRRATLAHELAHLLFDPQEQMQSIRVDSYDEMGLNPEIAAFRDVVEQRANAFAIEFLAPSDAVRELVQPPFDGADVENVMQTFGLSFTAAKYHLSNSYWRKYDVPQRIMTVRPDESWMAAEDFALDYFRPEEVPVSRRGRFAGIIAACEAKRLISAETAALYLDCSIAAFDRDRETIRSLFPI